ncbi:predicted protein, partial [Nematostella vectensis]
EYQTVVDYLAFSNCTPAQAIEHDYIFWSGDFNFRINESIENIKGACSRQEYASLWQHDQGTKGAVSLRFTLYDQSFCFINSHFAAHAEYTEYRNSEYQTVVDYLAFPNCTPAQAIEHE